MTAPRTAAIFDLDGVLTDTAELHYRSWQRIADELGLPFDRAANEALRGLSREESLLVLLGTRRAEFDPPRRAGIAARKNDYYLSLVDGMTPADRCRGAAELLAALRARGARVAVASSSRNARRVLERLELESLLDAVVDGNDAPRSKPDPQVFLLAAQRVGLPPARCVVVEDAASGVEAALAAGMKVVGVGPAERVGRAHARVDSVAQLDAAALLGLLA